jgi:hypothetical protein
VEPGYRCSVRSFLSIGTGILPSIILPLSPLADLRSGP